MDKKVSTKEKVAYGIGDISNGMAFSCFALHFMFFGTNIVGMNPSHIGWALMIGRVWDALTDPFMGWVSDHTESRWGKRRPYLLFGAIPYALSFMALWLVPNFSDSVAIFAYVTISLIIFNTCMTVVFVPYTSLTAAITNDYDERTSLTGYRMSFSLGAQLIGAALPPALAAWAASDSGVSFLQNVGLAPIMGDWLGTARSGYALVGGLFGLILALSIWISFAGTRERDFGKEDNAPSGASPFDYASNVLSELSGNRPFRSSVIILLLSNTAAAIIASLLRYYLVDVMKLEASWQSYVIGTLFLSAILTIGLIWVPMARKNGKQETFQRVVKGYVVVLLILPFLPVGNLLLLFPVAMMAGTFYGAALTLAWAIIPDVVEFDELKTGKRREGLFYGGASFAYKMATAIAALMVGYILNWIGYQSAVAGQADDTVIGIRAAIAVLPIICLVIAYMFSKGHPLTAEKHKKILEELEEIKKQKGDA